MIDKDFILSCGFSNPVRYFDEYCKRFRVYYEIEGYGCKILVSPFLLPIKMCFPFYEMSILEQIDNFSDINSIESNTDEGWEVFANSTGNHITTFHYQQELINFMMICGKPIKIINLNK